MRFKQNPSDELAENVKTQIIEESSNREIEINSFVKSVQINKQGTSYNNSYRTVKVQHACMMLIQAYIIYHAFQLETQHALKYVM